jgi:shikimate dehydrogenase
LLDTIDKTAQVIGSINTIVNTDGVLSGYNSDGTGALQALQNAGCTPADKNVVLIGSGGAARAIAVTMAVEAQPSRLVILGIVEQECQKLASDIAQSTSLRPTAALLTDETLSEEIKACDILINSSPVGMYPKTDCSPVPRALLHKSLAVFDVVYNPRKTKLLSEAERTGCSIISGIEMFLHQAAIQFELWTGQPAPAEVMRAVLEKHFA